MNELTTIETMTSLQIAKVTGKPHNDVLKAIRAMEPAWKKVNGGNFSLVGYTDAKGEKRPCYSLTKTECLYIATKFNDEARAKLIIRWEELEREANQAQVALPQNYKEALVALVAEVERTEALQEQIKKDAPKVAFANAVLASRTSCLIGELAKVITQNGYKIGQNRFFEWLRRNGYLGTSGERRNTPNQQYLEQGLFEIKKGTRSGNDGVLYITTTTKVTPKGQAYFIDKFLKMKEAMAEEAQSKLPSSCLIG
ncbi:phage antirepressor KilAC domain-containing protein [Porphyromonas gingivicanis]|uniref:phage antirepressor KilAC domain-containing protein n=1 Tax=Porphyromonas gingivicanis TaxID=266762 RepID=UPI0006917AD3|nr:phage regulatory protein/antirepressor Ant [Porphyromonas gingivicanis]